MGPYITTSSFAITRHYMCLYHDSNMVLDCYITTRAIITLYKQIMVQLFSIEEKAVEKLLVVPIVTRVGFEPTKHIAVDLKSTPFDRSGTCPDNLPTINGGWIRTIDLRVMSPTR